MEREDFRTHFRQPKRDILMIMDDMNAEVGTNKNEREREREREMGQLVIV